MGHVGPLPKDYTAFPRQRPRPQYIAVLSYRRRRRRRPPRHRPLAPWPHGPKAPWGHGATGLRGVLLVLLSFFSPFDFSVFLFPLRFPVDLSEEDPDFARTANFDLHCTGRQISLREEKEGK